MDEMKLAIDRVRSVASGGTINGTYQALPFTALELFRADLTALCDGYPNTRSPDPSRDMAGQWQDIASEVEHLYAKATARPWELDRAHDPDAEYGSGPDPDRGFDNYEILAPDGAKILGTEDAAHKEIEADQDEDGNLHAWDRIGRVNAELVIHAVNNIERLEAHTASLSQRLEAAGEALAPFAKVAEHDIGRDEADADSFRPMTKHNHAPRLTVGDLRRALKALATIRTSAGEGGA